MCIVPVSKLSADDLAVLAGRPSPTPEPEDGGMPTLVISEPRPGDAFGFGPVCLSQIIQLIDRQHSACVG